MPLAGVAIASLAIADAPPLTKTVNTATNIARSSAAR
jgi:hypothetical protein